MNFAVIKSMLHIYSHRVLYVKKYGNLLTKMTLYNLRELERELCKLYL